MFGWVKSHWKAIASVAVAAVVFTAVTVATGGLGAPLLVSLAAGGFASGVAGYVTGELLDGRKPTVKQALVQGGVAAGITVATFGVGRVLAPVASRVLAPVAARVLPEGATAVVPQIVRQSATNTTVGAAFGAGVKVAENAVRGRPLGEGVGDAAALGAVNGLLMERANRVAARIQTPRLAAPVEPSAPRYAEVRKPIAQAKPVEEPTGTTPGSESHESWKRGIPEPALEDPVADVGYFMKDVPTLEGQVATLQGEGWKIRYGEPGKGSWANETTKEIVIDPTLEGPVDTLKTLAHEVGHALEKPTPFRDPQAMTRDEYVATRLHDMALSEGQAVLNEMNALEAFRQSVRGRTGTSPELPYQGPYRQIAQNKSLSVEQKIEQIGTRYMRDEVPSVYDFSTSDAPPRYNEHWSDLFGGEWDEAHGVTTTVAAPSETKGLLGALGGN